MKKNIFDTYADAVAKHFHITLDQMFSPSRRRDLVDARQLLYYICMERPIRLSYIQRFLSENVIIRWAMQTFSLLLLRK